MTEERAEDQVLRPDAADTGMEGEPERYYPNKIGRLYLISLEDVMGRNGVNALLNMAGLRDRVNNYPPNDLRREYSFTELSTTSQALETMYGLRGARGMELRAGRVAFNYGLKEFGPLLGMADLALKLMPLGMKLKIALNAVAQTFDRFSDQPTHVEERKGQFHYVIEKCPVCWHRHSDSACCHIARGIIEESLRWVSGGKNFRVEEIECRATGDPTCTFVIDKEPLD
jgi:bacteriochlorophyll 4-vinyl reductase